MNHRAAIVSSTLGHDHPLIYQQLALPLSQSGWRVEIINPRFEGSDDNKIRFHRLPMEEKLFFRAANKRRLITEALLASRADICILHEPMLLPLIKRLKRLMPIQTVFIFGEQQQNAFLKKSPVGKTFLKRFLPAADSVVISSPEQIPFLEKLDCRIETAADAKALCELCRKLEQQGRFNI